MPAMPLRQRSGSTLCPSCGQLVGVGDDRCLGCGRARPGLFGFTALLHGLGRTDLGFAPLVTIVCGALYIASLALTRSSGDGGPVDLSFLNPGAEVVARLGAAGSIPVFRLGRWWISSST
jgi:rhomboid protease GluP